VDFTALTLFSASDSFKRAFSGQTPLRGSMVLPP
jgi:hypothetical protein